ncbi:Six-hairpin glycosidase-like protein [Dactylonectria macrodidyma]|uniref:Six-hairpin glycosidase-like protein n=1 Tax=Dactylonectria macrodidyma TaxID=307937 RepID=A0A9P9J6A8_9HYPO|nr:Six-hairpin glycosidase-like protein [Dactylonectria macrodidyma]
MIVISTLCCVLVASLVDAKIDRRRIVSDNNVVRTKLIDRATTPLQVGNGDFAFSVDTTGMQTYLPFNTMSVWAWHNDTIPKSSSIGDYTGVPVLTHGRNVSYEIPDPELPEVTQWLIGNPNRINLGRIGLRYNNDTLQAGQISNTRQELDLWNGTIISTFEIAGSQVKVVTQGDFDSDAVSFNVESELIRSNNLTVELDFPYPPIHTTTYKYEVFAGVYTFPANHTTAISSRLSKDTAHIRHEMQETKYFVNLRWPKTSPLSLSRLEPADSVAITAHRYALSPTSYRGSKPTQLSLTAHFSTTKNVPALPSTIMQQNRKGWNNYWKQGGFIDLTESSNPNATELQRRIVQSQYHVRVNSAGTGQPPQESGLMNNGWYGKFHMEMVVWHCAHWVSWRREKYFHKIFPAIYESLLPTAFSRAKRMGWSGARWPKMTEAITGRSSPGGINGFLLWQQPHPMYLAELAYKTKPTRQTLQRWEPILDATAEYMASYAWHNESSGHYDLGPPSYGVTENTPPAQTLNLAYEVAYWRYGIDVARKWKKKLGKSIPQHWTDVANNLAKPPQIDGLYTVYEGLNASWWKDPALIGDPRSLNMLKGILPNTSAVDEDVARLTADKVWDIWPDNKIRGWGRPILAINSARIGNPERAIHHLTAYDYWRFDDAGFAIRGGDGGTPPPFMPGNAGLLLAVAYMAEGWDGSFGHAPGFPDNAGWVVRKENLRKAL